MVPFPLNRRRMGLIYCHFLYHISEQLRCLIRRKLLSGHVLCALPYVHGALKHLTTLSGEFVALVLNLSQIGVDCAVVGEQVSQLIEFELHLRYLEVN